MLKIIASLPRNSMFLKLVDRFSAEAQEQGRLSIGVPCVGYELERADMAHEAPLQLSPISHFIRMGRNFGDELCEELCE
jgi:hypothetical protein